MPLLCGKNPALGAINAVTDSIKAQLAGGKGALGGLASLAASAKSKLTSLKAQLPSLDSFQSELAALRGAGVAELAAFKAKWGGKVPNLDALVSKVTGSIADFASIDFCNAVPNVKMDPATGAVVTEAKVAQTPNAAPEKPAVEKPTVVDNAKKPSTGVTQEVFVDVKTDFEEKVRKPMIAQVFDPLVGLNNSLVGEKTALLKTSDSVSLTNKKSKSGKTGQQLAAEGALTSGEVSAQNKINLLVTKIGDLTMRRQWVEQYYLNLKTATLGGVTRFSRSAAEKVFDDDPVIKTMGLRKYFTTTASIVDANTALIKRWFEYDANKKA